MFITQSHVAVKVKYASCLVSREIKAEFLIASVVWQDRVNKSDVHR
jgi:hypothetical protein